MFFRSDLTEPEAEKAGLYGLAQKLQDILIDFLRLLLLHPVAALGDILDAQAWHPGIEIVGQGDVQGDILLAPDQQRRGLDLEVASAVGARSPAEELAIVGERGLDRAGLAHRLLVFGC